jgi:hypothetical protein
VSAGSGDVFRNGELSDVGDILEHQSLNIHETRLLFLNMAERIIGLEERLAIALKQLEFLRPRSNDE